MLKVERVSVMNLDNAIRGARNPLNSWAKSDSTYNEKGEFVLGPNDLSLAVRLAHAGSDHRKYLRQVMVCMDVTAPMYWWKEFDTYKVGTVANSCSTMHKIQAKVFEPIDFSIEHLNKESYAVFNTILAGLNVARDNFLENKDKDSWWQMIQLLPTSYNQLRTVTMTYENVVSIINQRHLHMLDEWVDFCKILMELPYVKLIMNPQKSE